MVIPLDGGNTVQWIGTCIIFTPAESSVQRTKNLLMRHILNTGMQFDQELPVLYITCN